MSEQFTQNEVQQNETQDSPIVEDTFLPDNDLSAEAGAEVAAKQKKKITKKTLTICIVALAAIIALVVAFLIPSKFERVKSEAVHIAGMVTGSGNYFTIDTYPDEYKNMDEMLVSLLLPRVQENALEAIRYVNEELGFDGSVYSLMMKTTALMGRQTEENSKYKVSWTYHPDEGLEVTYRKK